MKFNYKKVLKGVMFLMKNKDSISMVIVFALGLKHYALDQTFFQNLIDAGLVLFYLALNIFYDMEE
jgi:hypothetical protein